MPRTPRAAAPVAVALLLAACGDDAAGPDDTLTDAEAAALAEVVLGLTLDASLRSQPLSVPVPAPARAPVPIDLTFAFEPNCPLGGTMEVDLEVVGVVDPETEAGDLTMTLVEVPHACVVRHEDSGRHFTLDGAPAVTVTVDAVSDGSGTTTLEGAYEGALDWATDDDRGGTCAFDLVFAGTGNDVTDQGSGTLQGTVCGIDVDHAWSS